MRRVMPSPVSVSDPAPVTVGVLALQGAFAEHVQHLRQAAAALWHQQPLRFRAESNTPSAPAADGDGDGDGDDIHPAAPQCRIIEVRTPPDLARCDALVIPGGESTAIGLLAQSSGLLEPLRHFVQLQRKPTWGTCAGLVLLAARVDGAAAAGQALVGSLNVRVRRNHFGRQAESFAAALDLSAILHDGGGGEKTDPFHAVFIRAPVVESILSRGGGTSEEATDVGAEPDGAAVEVLARLPARAGPGGAVVRGEDEGAIVAVRQGNVFATAFHPELTDDVRIHRWWLGRVLEWRGMTG